MNRIINKIESIVKTDVRYLAKGTFWLGVAQAASAGSSFILAVALGHLLTQSSLGEYKFIITVAGLIESLGLSGMGIALVQSIARGRDGTLSVAFRENLRWSFLMVAACIGISIYYGFHGNATYAASFLLIGLLLPVIKSVTLWGPYLNGKKRFRAASILYALFVAVFSATLIGAALISTRVISIVVCYFIASLILNGLLYLIVTRLYPVQNDYSEKKAVTYAAHLSAMGILHAVADKIDSILVFFFMGPAHLAVYSFALAMPEQIKALSKNFSAVIFPKLSLKDLEGLQRMVLRRTLEITAVAVALTIAYILAAPYIFKLLFPQYLDSILYSQIYCISLIPAMASMLPQTALRSLANERQLYILNISASVILIISLFFGVRYYAIWGAIAAITIVRIYRVICGYVLLKRMRPESMPPRDGPDPASREFSAPTI